jgi:Flp pilus assembly protein TadB
MFTVDTSSNWTVSSDLVKFVVIGIIIFMIYFFSFQLQVIFAKLLKKFSEKIGVYSTSKEYAMQRYVYQHSSSLIAKLYNWVNNQLVALGLKRLGVSVVGYLLFWAVISFIISIVLNLLTQMGVLFFPFMFLMIFVITLVMTRVMVSERMEMREADVMNAIDLIVPEVHNGVKNAIVTYKDNFAPSVKDDFQAFIINIQDRGYTFEDAMYILADNLGLVFNDFAQKAIYFEAVGEREMVEIFADITETNRLRRQLRDENNNQFAGLKASFVVSAGMTFAYFIFLMFTDDFSRTFFLTNTIGKFLLLIIVGVVFAVLSYITTIKSQTI